MTVVSTTQDTEALTLTVVSDLAAAPSRVWQLWSDPRQLDRWWGPPGYPMTFDKHDFMVGGGARYSMDGPDGDKAHGWWTFHVIDEPRLLELEDGFVEETGLPGDGMRMTVDFAETATGTRMTVLTQFVSIDQMKMMTDMGMAEGMTAAAGQIDAILAES